MSTGEVCSAEDDPGRWPRGLSAVSPLLGTAEYRDLFELDREDLDEPKLLDTKEAVDFRESYEELMRQQYREGGREESGEVNTLYKKVKDKIKPVDTPRKDAPMELGREDWKERAIARQMERAALRGPDLGPYDHIFARRTADFARGTRLTPERLAKMNMGEELWPKEIELLQGLMFQREDALAWDFKDMTFIHEDVQPAYKIRTIPHNAFQVKGFQCPRKLEPIVIAMIKDRLNRGTLERGDGQYRNPYFLVPKVKNPMKPADFRLINNATQYNAFTERDAYIPSSADEFSERFAGRAVYSYCDLFSGYDQIPLHTSSRDMTAFQTPIGLVRQCALPMGATNSVAVFIRTVMKILADHFPEAAPFIDDIGIAGPRSKYGDEEILKGVRRYIMEHAQQVDRVLTDLARAQATVSAKKSWWGVSKMVIVGYEVDSNGRFPNTEKVSKILDWPECRTVKEVRQFLGIAVYYRQWIFCFSLKAEPLFRLLRKDAKWFWGEPQRHAMRVIKGAISRPPALAAIDYKGGPIFLGVDASNFGGGAHLEQVDADGLRHSIRFDSTLWSESESQQHSTKLECKALVWALKAFQPYLYGHHFTVETDAKVLIAQLNRSSSDLPGSVMNRWLATILQWDFDIVHVPGKKNVIPDALLRYPQADGWSQPQADEDDLEPFVDRMLNKHEEGELAMNIETAEDNGRWLCAEYDDRSEEIAVFLKTLGRPMRLRGAEKRAWTKRASNFFVRERHLFRKATKAMPARRVIDSPDIQAALIQDLHEYLGHKGIQTTFGAVSQRYWWEGMYRQVAKQLGPCKTCQMMRGNRKEAELNTTFSRAMWTWWTIDITYMPHVQGKGYLVVAREYLSGWPEARGLRDASSEAVAQFIFEEICCRWGVPLRISVDGGPENKSVVRALATLFGIHRVQASAYNSRAQGLIERGHQGFLYGLAKMPGTWLSNPPAITWAERVSLRRPLGYSPAQLVLGQNPMLPIELVVPTWQSLPWSAVQSHADLLAVRATQLQFRKENLEEAVNRTRHLRREAVEGRNEKREIATVLKEGDLVLIWDAVKAIDKSRDRKLEDRWLGPYRVHTAWPDQGYYRLEDLNGVKFPSTTRVDRLKKFKEMPTTLEDDILKGRLRIYPETEGFRMVTPQPKALKANQQPVAATAPAPLSSTPHPEIPAGEETVWKGWVTSGSYVPDKTSNNAPGRAVDKISKANILRTSRRGVGIQDSDSRSDSNSE